MNKEIVRRPYVPHRDFYAGSREEVLRYVHGATKRGEIISCQPLRYLETRGEYAIEYIRVAAPPIPPHPLQKPLLIAGGVVAIFAACAFGGYLFLGALATIPAGVGWLLLACGAFVLCSRTGRNVVVNVVVRVSGR